MITVKGVFKVGPGSSDGRWTASVVNGASLPSFADREAALEWTADRLAEKLDTYYRIDPTAKGWEGRIENGISGLHNFITRDAALEWCVVHLATKLRDKIEKEQKKARKK